uniref:40S ribosomal protein S25 n=1 Tax=Antonospora locustae TaxID=278021 RepID=Q6E6G6_ANTLO|nr:small subunit ribosomal protein S25e [Antonospora locustae]6ZU5_SZ0 Chain SZ0, eS25 [Paranosema locustae]|eukprot:jgi/Antlo1/1937/715
MVKKVLESKEKKAAKIASTSNKEKKKWTQGKTREAVRRSVTVEADVFSKIERDVAKASLVTAPSVAEKFNLNVGVAQKILEHLCAGGVLCCLSRNSRLRLYSRAQKVGARPADTTLPAAEAPAQTE